MVLGLASDTQLPWTNASSSLILRFLICKMIGMFVVRMLQGQSEESTLNFKILCKHGLLSLLRPP